MLLARFAFVTVILICATPVIVYPQCSIVSLSGLSQVEEPGTPVRITAQVPPTIPSAKLIFKWKLSVGRIMSGDDTSSITIDTAGLGGQTITVSVEVIGATSPCAKTAEKTIEIRPIVDCCFKFDEYGDIKFEDEKARLDNFAIAVSHMDQSKIGHIIAYAGKRTYHNEASERLTRAKNYLVKVRGIEPNRIITLDAGHTEEFHISFWIVPSGLSSIDLKEDPIPLNQLDFTKPRPNQSKRPKRRH